MEVTFVDNGNSTTIRVEKSGSICVHFPFIAKNEKKALLTLGGQQELNHIASHLPKTIPLNFSENGNALLTGEHCKSFGLLIKCKKKKNSSSLVFSVLNVIHNEYKFNSSFDFQVRCSILEYFLVCIMTYCF